MPRVEGIMQPLPNVYGTPGRPIESAKYNSQIDDLIADANAARPITAGGTGGSTPAAAREALGIPDPASAVKKAGDRMTGSLSSAVSANERLTGGTKEIAYAVGGNTREFTVAGAVTFNPTGLAAGDVLQVNFVYESGSIAVSRATQWELGGGAKSSAIADVGVTLTAGAAYRIVFEVVAGVLTGVFQ